MKIKYDNKTDCLSISLTDSEEYFESEEIEQNFILDFNKNGKVIGIEILNASKRADLKSITFEPLAV